MNWLFIDRVRQSGQQLPMISTMFLPSLSRKIWLPNSGAPSLQWPGTSVQSDWQSIGKSFPRNENDVIWNKFEFWEPLFPCKDEGEHETFRILDPQGNSIKTKFHHWDKCHHQRPVDIRNPGSWMLSKECGGLSMEWLSQWQGSMKPGKGWGFLRLNL